MGRLYLPSSVSDTNFLVIDNISQTEAETFCDRFTDDALATRKSKVFDQNEEQPGIVFYNNYLNNNGEVLQAGSSLYQDVLLEYERNYQVVANLSYSRTTGVRGRRAVFVDFENNMVGVGTTVIYNRNWVTTSYIDPNTGTLLQSLKIG